ncbi:hypothetical protein KMS84_31630 [Streptomyces sp. IBSBF 2807]|nr:hypothetical protein [Streptomyces hilarionis]
MRSPTRAGGRRGAFRSASAAAAVVVGAAALAVGCGGGGHGGDYVAIGAVGDPPSPGANGTAGPTGGVRLVPLDGQRGSPGGRPGTGASAENAATGVPTSTGPGGRMPASAPSSAAGDTSAGRTTPVPPVPSPSSPPSPPRSPAPASMPPGPSEGASGGPAALSVSEPVRAKTDRRWCEDVTLTFVNSGGRAVGSGTIAFGTHVVDALGTDWATRRSTTPLPAPIAAGARSARTWTVCVDAWRVPLGMHVETRDVSVRWE